MRLPDLEQGGIKAWRLEPSGATVAHWLVQGAFHPAWNQWIVACITLADSPGFPPAKRHYPEAEHEIDILSLNPEHPFIEGEELHWLTPPDLTCQFDGVTDAQATEVVEGMVRAILSGEASPDSDWRSWWETSIAATVAHFKAGDSLKPEIF